jgi:hypothetical protein
MGKYSNIKKLAAEYYPPTSSPTISSIMDNVDNYKTTQDPEVAARLGATIEFEIEVYGNDKFTEGEGNDPNDRFL